MTALLQDTNSFTPHSPRPDQAEAIKKATKHYRLSRNGKLIMPCGSGKTLTSLWIKDALKSRATIFAIPTLTLQSQTLRTFVKNIIGDISEHKIILIGSDTTVGKDYGVIPYTEELQILREVKAASRSRKPFIIFTTYHSSDILASIIKNNAFKFDLCIFDEAHHTAGFNKIIFQSLMKLPEKNIKRRVFMTATPRMVERRGGISENKGFDPEFFSMDDENVYGKTFHELTITEAIEKDIIVPYKISTINLSSPDVIEMLQKNSIWKDVNLNKDLESEARMFAAAVTLVKFIRKKKINHVVSFASTVERSKQFKKVLDTVAKSMLMDLRSFHIDHNHNETERNQLISDFMACEYSVITNAKLLGEGFDMPAVDAVLFLDDRKSISDIVQFSGRAWRKGDGKKKFAHIILPVVVDAKSKISSPGFEFLRYVVTAFGANDKRLFDIVKSKNKTGRENESIIDIDFTPVDFDFEGFKEDLRIQSWNSLKGFYGYKRFLNENEFIDYAKNVLIPIGIDSRKKYTSWVRGTIKFEIDKPDNIPVHPYLMYNNPRIYSIMFDYDYKKLASAIPFEDFASFYTNSLRPKGIITRAIYNSWRKSITELNIKIPAGIPYNPWLQYGTKKVAKLFETPPVKKVWMSKYQIDSFISKKLIPNGVNTSNHFNIWMQNSDQFPKCPKRPFNLPTAWRNIYGKEFIYSVFEEASSFLEFQEFKEYVQTKLIPFGINNYNKYRLWSQGKLHLTGAPKIKPDTIPSNPWKVYSKNNFDEVFGVPSTRIPKLSRTKFIIFAKNYLAKNNIDTLAKYLKWRKTTKTTSFLNGSFALANLPRNPKDLYGFEIISEAFKTKSNKLRTYVTKNEFIEFVNSLKIMGIKNTRKYTLWSKWKITIQGCTSNKTSQYSGGSTK